MLKKPVALAMLALYLITATGFALNIHYCFNRVTGVKIDAPTKSCNGQKQTIAKKHDCCKDRVVKVKVNDEHQSEAFSFLSKIFYFHLPKLPFEDFLFSVQRAIADRFFERGPPLLFNGGIPIIIKNCVFRI